MTKSQSDIDELKALGRKAAELRGEHKRSRAAGASVAGQPSKKAEAPVGEAPAPAQRDTAQPSAKRGSSRSMAGKKSGTLEEGDLTKPSTQEATEEASSPETDEGIGDLAAQIESIVRELEEAARERPAVALLAAFTIGIVIGQLFSRR